MQEQINKIKSKNDIYYNVIIFILKVELVITPLLK